ncbi:MAG: MFS transporter [Clostridia bacterium]|nr:MFS transporter [Clostridia bacterium]
MEDRKFSRSNWFILLVFGLVGQIAWSVENMCFNTFVFSTIAPDLDAITLMVQLSGVCATVVTLVAGTLSDKLGNRRLFISIGYMIWGVSVAAFGFISPELVGAIFGTTGGRAVSLALTLVIVGDCVMTTFGSAANDAAFNAWITDNTSEDNRTGIEGVLSVLALVGMLIVAGGFGILSSFIDYSIIFLALGIIISALGVLGLFKVRDRADLSPSGRMRDIFYGFKPSVVRTNGSLYLSLVIVGIYGIACQMFMPYLIIYMKEYLGFSDIEYSLVFGLAIVLGSAVNLYVTRLSNKLSKTPLLYIATATLVVGLIMMYFSRGISHVATLLFFGIAGFVMISGYIFVSALVGSNLRDYTPAESAGKLQGVRMVFSVLIPMLVGPMIGNAINKARNIPLADATSPDLMTTSYVPAPEIFIAAAGCAALIFAVIPLLSRSMHKESSAK